MSFLIPGGKLLALSAVAMAVRRPLVDGCGEFLPGWSFLVLGGKLFALLALAIWIPLVDDGCGFVLVDFELDRFLGPFPLYSTCFRES